MGNRVARPAAANGAGDNVGHGGLGVQNLLAVGPEPLINNGENHLSDEQMLNERNQRLAPRRNSAVFIEFQDEQKGPNWSPWKASQPEDVFVHIFGYLHQKELCSVAEVNRYWNRTVYEPSLWTTIHLCHMYNRVDDLLLAHLISSGRFSGLEVLCLDNCSAITNKSLETLLTYCPALKCLSLANCERIPPFALLEFVRLASQLRKLECIGVTREFSIAAKMEELNSKLDLGLFYVEYCSEYGLKVKRRKHWNERRFSFEEIERKLPENSSEQAGVAMCRHAESRNNERGCWGRVKGRIVYSNNIYHSPGNFPNEVLYSCEQHAENDFTDADYERCRVCERLFRAESMYSNLICKCCFDNENLAQKHNWIPLEKKNIQIFGFGEVVSKTIRIADRKNIPKSLRSFGTQECKLDYTLPQMTAASQNIENPENNDVANESTHLLRRSILHRRAIAAEENEEEEKKPFLQNVPLSLFLEKNGTRLDQTLHNIKKKLKSAKQGGNTRALLVLNEAEDIEVFADQRVIADGYEGEAHLRMIQLAWTEAQSFIYPVFLILLFSYFFSYLFRRSIEPHYDGKTNYTVYLNRTTNNDFDPLILIILGAGMFLFLLFAIFMFFRFRAHFELWFKRFLVLDLFAIQAFGIGVILYTFFQWTWALFDWVSFALIIFNVAMIGIVSFYVPVPQRLHQVATAGLNTVMAILLAATLGRWFVFAVCCLVAVADTVSEYWPRIRLLPPLLVPDAAIIQSTPKILFGVNGLHVRPAELMLYGMMVTLSDSLVIGMCLILALMSIIIFVLPYCFGKKRFLRPLPVMFAFMILIMLIQNNIIQPYTVNWSYVPNIIQRPVVM